MVSTTGTTEGDTVTLQCEDGLFPMESITITCSSAGVWSPDPAELVCIVPSGIILYASELVIHGCMDLKRGWVPLEQFFEL